MDDNLRNCSSRLYPLLHSDAVQSRPALDDLVGSYFDAGYGFANITLRCDNWTAATGSPTSLSLTSKECRLVIERSELFGKRVSFQLQHVSGDKWLAWLFVDDYATINRPTGCYRAQLWVGSDGKPGMIGLDIVMEGNDVPLIWFKRV